MNTSIHTARHARLLVIAAVVFAGACLIALTCACQAQALSKGQTFTTGGNTYKIIDYEPYDDDPPEARLVKYGSSNKTPTINTVKYQGVRFEVEEIGKNAFNNAAGHKIVEVTLGSNVDYIGAKAFYGCKKLKTINMRRCECIDIDREGGRYVIDDLDVGKNAFKACGKKGVVVKCGNSNAKYRALYKKALKKRGMRASVKVVR